MCRPCRCGDKIAVNAGIINRDFSISPTGKAYFGGAGRIGRYTAIFEDIRRSKNLRTVADRGNRFVAIVEVATQTDVTTV